MRFMRSFSIRTPVRYVVLPLAVLTVLLLLAWYFIQPLAFPSLAQQEVEQLSRKALEIFDGLEDKNEFLRTLIWELVSRKK